MSYMYGETPLRGGGGGLLTEVVGADDEVVGGHADHIGLDDGFEAEEHAVAALGVGGVGEEVVVLEGVEDVVVEACGLLAVEEEGVVAFDVLVDVVAVVNGPRGLVGVEHVLAESGVGLVVAEDAEDGGHDVDLLHDAGEEACGELTGGVVDGYGDGEEACGGEAFGVLELVGVVGGEDEEGVAEPGLLAGGLEEAAQGVVGVLDGAVDGQGAAGEGTLVALGDAEGVVRGGGEEAHHEGLVEALGDGVGGELEELLVPDGSGRRSRCGRRCGGRRSIR